MIIVDVPPSTKVAIMFSITVVVSSLPANVADVVSRIFAPMVEVSASSVTSTVVGITMVVEMLSPLPWNSPPPNHGIAIAALI